MVIRDAAIRLTLQQVETPLKAPNVAPVVQATKAQQAAIDAAQKSVVTHTAAVDKDAKALSGWERGLQTASKAHQQAVADTAAWTKGLEELGAQRKATAAAEKAARKAAEAEVKAARQEVANERARQDEERVRQVEEERKTHESQPRVVSKPCHSTRNLARASSPLAVA